MYILSQKSKKSKENKGVGGYMVKKELPRVCVPDEKDLDKRIQEERREDYRRQEKIQLLLKNKGYENDLTKCLRTPVGKPYLAKAKKSGRVGYGNISTCNNVWLCPVCSKKINKKRALEIVRLVTWAYKNKYTVCMLTFTHPHSKDDSLVDLKKKHALALNKFRGGKMFQIMKQKMGYIGSVTGNEVTYGINGWHWHTHILFVVEDDLWIKENEKKLKDRWYSCLKLAKMKGKKKDILEHGLNLQYEMHDSEYLTKFGMGYWGADKEISGGAKKKGIGKNPWELAEGNRREKELFMEYAKAVSLENKTYQIRWSKGLKDKVGIREKTDAELNMEKEESELLGYLSIEDWKMILRYKARALILNIAENEGFFGVAKWLERHYLMVDTA